MHRLFTKYPSLIRAIQHQDQTKTVYISCKVWVMATPRSSIDSGHIMDDAHQDILLPPSGTVVVSSSLLGAAVVQCGHSIDDGSRWEMVRTHQPDAVVEDDGHARAGVLAAARRMEGKYARSSGVYAAV
ncbi:hypothetical protein GSI_00214 [Ganoderma sinense ZZ0214-1]|uniref:Uncharacterized protein n=1 Tax=Ganoderma sinense ZZ0214-1 TaxID=1077348 RepID=A0A2G8SRX7_9APHY|nr:hypothetical protein GSI_00214 [Ganoderma sinense ZZ0214-1]